MGKVVRYLLILAGGYGLHFPARLLEDWVMGSIEQAIQENWQIIISYSLVWGLPLLASFFLVLGGYKLRDWERKKVKWDVAVKPVAGKRGSYQRSELTAWADLEITNTSPSVDLANVSVKILELTLVYEKHNEEGIGTGIYHLSEPHPKWSPANVYWSGRTGTSGEFIRPIHPGETQYATIAFHHEHGSGIAMFNILTHSPMLESKIVIEVSSPGMNMWKRAYYIEYHPSSKDEFDFVEWDSWKASHKVIEQSTVDKEGSQP